MPHPDTVVETRIDADLIRSALAQAGHAAADLRLQVVDETGSTNSDLLQRARAGEYPTAALLARAQSSGRGRRDRPWVSRPGESLALSIGYPLPRPAHGLAGLPLALGVAVRAALARIGADTRLKWPNDVVLQHGGELAKLAGILVETVGMDDSQGTYVVAGIGLNLHGAQSLRALTGRAVADLAALVPHADPNQVAALLVLHVLDALERFARRGFPAFRTAFEEADAFMGQAATVTHGATTTHAGIVRGVNDEGALLIETPAGIAAVVAGEVSLHRQGQPATA